MAQLEDARLPVGAPEALVNDPDFLRQLVEAALKRLLDAEIAEHLQPRPCERSDARTGSRHGYRARSSRHAPARSRFPCQWISMAPSRARSSITTDAARRCWWAP